MFCWPHTSATPRSDICIICFSFPFPKATEEDLSNEFSRHGSVKDVFLPVDRDTGRKKGSAFVTFVSVADATEAVRALNKYV